MFDQPTFGSFGYGASEQAVTDVTHGTTQTFFVVMYHHFELLPVKTLPPSLRLSLPSAQVHQRDVFMDLCRLYKERKLSSSSDFEWLKQVRVARPCSYCCRVLRHPPQLFISEIAGL